MNNNTKVWICEPCNFVFQTYGKSLDRQRKHYFCPNCGEMHSVVKYKADRINKKRKDKKKVYQLWTDEELEVVKRVLNGEMMIYQAAVMLGRSSKSVRRRLDRLKEEQLRASKKAMCSKHTALLKAVILNMDMTNFRITSVECYGYDKNHY